MPQSSFIQDPMAGFNAVFNPSLNTSGLRFNSALPDPAPAASSVVPNPAADATSGGTGGFLSGLWGSMFDKKVGDTTTQGWLGPTMGVVQGLGNAYTGMKQYGLAKDALKEQQRQFNVNYEAQRKMTNSMLEDRQRSRVAANPGAYQSVGDYMQKYGV